MFLSDLLYSHQVICLPFMCLFGIEGITFKLRHPLWCLDDSSTTCLFMVVSAVATIVEMMFDEFLS